jgi:hypothetical protein
MEREWFYRAGFIRLLKAEDNKTALVQYDVVIFEFSVRVIGKEGAQCKTTIRTMTESTILGNNGH